MRIALVGYGKMGRMIKQSALCSSHEIAAIIDPFSDDADVTGKSLASLLSCDFDVVIDFSCPSSAYENILFYAEHGMSAVIGTTGWYSRLDEIKSRIDPNACSIIYSGNFSIGFAMMMKTVAYISRLMDKVPSYDVCIEEVHHRAKADSPSGTAEMLKEIVLENIGRKKSTVYGNAEGRIGEDELQVASIRLGSVSGIHDVIFDSDADTIEIKHSARSRKGFADGAVKAASWIYGRKGFFSFDDFINDFLGV